MNRKIIPFPNRCIREPNAKDDGYEPDRGEIDTKGDIYVEHLQAIGNELQQVANNFELSIKEVISDFTYIVVGNAIVAALVEDDSDEDED